MHSFAQRNFNLNGEQVVETGGPAWTWKNFWSGVLSSEEGVRLPGRIWIGLSVMLIVTGIGIFYALALLEVLGDEVEELRREAGRQYAIVDVGNISAEEWITYSQDDLRIDADEQKLLDTIPERW